ncbi:MAG: acetylxylan esterase [Prevotella sp.]|nr:acetylxylan esterase [Prevotella sp.]
MKRILTLAVLAAATAYSLAQATNWRALRFNQSNAFYSYLMEDMHRCYWQRQQELQQAVKSKTALQRYIADARQRMQQVIGELPERTPLQAQVTGTIQMEGFRVEKIVFQSTPGRYVTAHLYLSDGIKAPVPACIDMCGHGTTGKGRGSLLPARMALNGIAVMVVDPIAQGERLQLIDRQGNDLTRGVTTEHTLLNPAFELLGSSLAAQEFFDNSRAIDYLVSRPDIDAGHIGCYGFSGGGTQCAYLTALDRRVKASCVGLFFSSRERTIEKDGASDGCQQASGEGRARIEIADMALMNADREGKDFLLRPFLILDGKYDFVDHWGALRGFDELKQCYELQGIGDRLDQYYAEDGHAMPEDIQQRMLSFFHKWLANGSTPPAAMLTSPSPSVLTPMFNDFLCTARGQVNLQYPDAKSTMQLTAEKMDRQKPAREQFCKANLKDIRRQLMQLLGIQQFNDRIEIIPTGKSPGRGYEEYRFQVNCEGEMPVACVVLVPETATSESAVEIHLHQNGKAWYLNDLMRRDFSTDGTIIVAADVRGVGEMEDPYLYNLTKYWNREYRCAAAALHIDRPLIGQRVCDVRTLLNFCNAHELLNGRPLRIVADGLFGPVVMHAAVLDERIQGASLTATLKTWRSYVESPMQRDMLSNVVPGALQYYDLPDLLTLCKGRVRITD